MNKNQEPYLIGCGIGCVALLLLGAVAVVIFLAVAIFGVSAFAGASSPLGYTFSEESRLAAALPATATDVQTEAVDLFPEYAYFLKAALPAADFPAYATAIDVSPHTPDRVYTDDVSWLGWPTAGGFTPDWWDTSTSLDDTYVRQSGGSWVMVKHEAGYVYVYAFGH